VITAIDRLRIR